MKRVLFEDAYLEAEYTRMRAEAVKAAENGPDPDALHAGPMTKDCRKCDGRGECPCCERECQVCDGTGRVIDEYREQDRREAIEDLYLSGLEPRTRICVACQRHFEEYVTVPRQLCAACLKAGKEWATVMVTT